ncbi:MAG: putative MFS family arabinose efflux permease [Arcticibacterium sp.]|jgi:predicted MFS family arabinose efflux permease
MIKGIALLYIESFKGLSKEVWWLSLVTFINLAGTMVLPFFAKYLKEDLGFSYEEVGWIMVFFGLEAFTGAWLGGKLTDRIGFYKVMIYSLFLSGLLFILLQYQNTLWSLCIGIFLVMTVADMFRPAMFVSLNTYSKPENRTRSLILIRLAINLGFVFGPTVAGLVIISSGYGSLFWIDGLTCITAGTLFLVLIKERKGVKKKAEKAGLFKLDAAVYKDKVYWLFLLVTFLIAVVFFQIFTTLPLYHKEHYGLSEFETGMIFFINGFVIVLFEMPMVHWIEKRKIRDTKLITLSTILIAISFFVLLIDNWAGILAISMVLITLGEMVGFPYTNAFAMKRAKIGNEGRYMALYSMAFAAAHILSPKIGMDIVARYGYNVNFLLLGSCGLLAVLLSLALKREINKESRAL